MATMPASSMVRNRRPTPCLRARAASGKDKWANAESPLRSIRVTRAFVTGSSGTLKGSRSMMTRRKLYLSLDSVNGETVMQILKEINKKHNMTIVLVIHESDFAGMAQRQIHLADGKVVKEGV